MGVYRLLRKATGSYGAGGAAGIAFLALYVLMIGWSVSVVRAFLMFLFRIGADMTGRHYDSYTALACSAAAVILWRPLYLYDGGFWLSFGAVLGMLAILPLFRGLPAAGLWASLSVNLAIFPILAYYFFTFPPYSLFLNLLVIPLFSILLLLGLVGSLVCFASFPAGALILRGCRAVFWIYEESCRLAGSLPGAQLVTGQPRIWQMAAYYVCLTGAALLLWKIRRDREQQRQRGGAHSRGTVVQDGVCSRGAAFPGWRAWAGAILLMTLGIVLMLPAVSRIPDAGKLSVTVLDVGQGDGIFIRGPNGGTYLVDGGSSDVKEVGTYRLEPFLKSQGESALDYVFVTHGDADHYSGIAEWIEQAAQDGGQGAGSIGIGTLVLPVEEVWDENLRQLAQKARKAGISVSVIRPGQRLREGEMGLTCLQPGADFTGEPGNEASLVLALQYGQFDMLLTGDTEGEGEEWLTGILERDYAGTSWEALKAAHHGSKNSTTEEFLGAASPAYTVISAGRDNRYGHPHPETLLRLEEAGSRIESTAGKGAICLKTDGKHLTIRGFCG